jgi:DNA-binding transcriptional ArsR family regulator
VTDERPKVNDPAMMRALAHPARLVILEHLAVNEAGATATECADVVGLSPSATSYHLRALAKAGMIEEGPGRGDGRERVWRRKQPNFSFQADLDATPEEFAAQTALLEAVMAHQNDKIRRYISLAREVGDAEWYNIVAIFDTTLALTAAEMSDLIKKINELLEPYVRSDRKHPPAGSRPVSFQLRTVPLRPGDMK